MEQQIDNRIQSFLDELTSQESVTRFGAAAGQVLVHRGHIPGGVFVVLTGDLALSTTQDADVRTITHMLGAHALRGKSTGRDGGVVVQVLRPYLIPHPSELEIPAAKGVRVVTDAELIHVPRSLMWLVPEIGDAIAHAPIPAVSLANPPLPWLETPRAVSLSRSTRVDGSSFPVDGSALSSK